MDKLTKMVEDYKETKDQTLIPKIQNIVYLIIKRLLNKWRIYSLPLIEQERINNDARTTILVEAMNLFDASKGAKFTSFYGTRLNYTLRAEYMKYYQKGNPIKKNQGRLNEISIEIETNDNNMTLEDILASDYDLRKEAQNNLQKDFMKEARKHLNNKERQVISLIYFKELPIKEVASKLNLSSIRVKKYESSAIKRMKRIRRGVESRIKIQII